MDNAGCFVHIRFRKMIRKQYLKCLVIGVGVLGPDELKAFAQELTVFTHGHQPHCPRKIEPAQHLKQVRSYTIDSPDKDLPLQTLFADTASADATFVLKDVTFIKEDYRHVEISVMF